MKATDDEIIEFMRNTPDPVLTAREVGDEFGLRRQSAHERLDRLESEGRVRRKDVGPAVVWYVDSE